MMTLKIELNVLQEEWKSLQRVINEIISSSIPDTGKYFDGEPLYGKVYALFNEYSDLRNRTRRVLEPVKDKVKDEILPSYLSFPSAYDSTYKKPCIEGWKTVSFLTLMAKECSKALTLITGLTSEISLTPPKEEELKMLEDEIKAEVEPFFPLYSSELLQSIKSLRKAEFLGSTLICGRMIDIIIDKCKKKLSEDKEAEKAIEWKDVVEFLKNKAILSGKEGERILESIKLYRNKFAHEVGTYPSIEETILIISGTSLLIKKIAKKKEEFNFLIY
ncbi:MAG: hypothetical protein ACPLVJ_00085 [Candidatus Bathyarchaeales archaeon]